MAHLHIPRPFASSYAVNLTVAIVAIVPFIVVTTAAGLFRRQVATELGASLTGLAVISGLAIAGYAFGALLGGDLVQRFPQRRLFLICESLFVVGCLLAAGGQGVITYGAGRVLLGFGTGLLLVAALPPVIQNFPPRKMPVTAAVVNLGFFGAVAAGPLLGGIVAYGGMWRWLYGGLAVIGVVTVSVALFTLPDREPFNPGRPVDWSALVLALAATALPFWAAGELTGHGFSSLRFVVPLAIGLVCLLALLLSQYHKRDPMSPVKGMWHTYPVVGTLAAMFGGGAFVALLELVQRYQLLIADRTPLATGLAFWPQVLGVLVTVGLLRAAVTTRFLPLLTLSGMLMLLAGGALLLGLDPGHSEPHLLLAATGLLGLGAGATVAPGLFMAGFSLPSHIIGRIFALVELVRSEADFILAPVIAKVAETASGSDGLTVEGLRYGLWTTVLITGFMTLLGVAIYLAGAGFRLPQPDLDTWLRGDRPAFDSPDLGAALHRR